MLCILKVYSVKTNAFWVCFLLMWECSHFFVKFCSKYLQKYVIKYCADIIFLLRGNYLIFRQTRGSNCWPFTGQQMVSLNNFLFYLFFKDFGRKATNTMWSLLAIYFVTCKCHLQALNNKWLYRFCGMLP